MPVVRIPIMSCPECHRPFNVDEWKQLLVADEQPANDKLTRRLCSRCAAPMAIEESNVDELDDVMDADIYAEMWPHSELPAMAYADDRRRRNRRLRIVGASVGATVAAAVAAALTYL